MIRRSPAAFPVGTAAFAGSRCDVSRGRRNVGRCTLQSFRRALRFFRETVQNSFCTPRRFRGSRCRGLGGEGLPGGVLTTHVRLWIDPSCRSRQLLDGGAEAVARSEVLHGAGCAPERRRGPPDGGALSPPRRRAPAGRPFAVCPGPRGDPAGRGKGPPPARRGGSGSDPGPPRPSGIRPPVAGDRRDARSRRAPGARRGDPARAPSAEAAAHPLRGDLRRPGGATAAAHRHRRKRAERACGEGGANGRLRGAEARSQPRRLQGGDRDHPRDAPEAGGAGPAGGAGDDPPLRAAAPAVRRPSAGLPRASAQPEARSASAGGSAGGRGDRTGAGGASLPRRIVRHRREARRAEEGDRAAEGGASRSAAAGLDPRESAVRSSGLHGERKSEAGG